MTKEYFNSVRDSVWKSSTVSTTGIENPYIFNIEDPRNTSPTLRLEGSQFPSNVEVPFLDEIPHLYAESKKAMPWIIYGLLAYIIYSM